MAFLESTVSEFYRLGVHNIAYCYSTAACWEDNLPAPLCYTGDQLLLLRPTRSLAPQLPRELCGLGLCPWMNRHGRIKEGSVEGWDSDCVREQTHSYHQWFSAMPAPWRAEWMSYGSTSLSGMNTVIHVWSVTEIWLQEDVPKLLIALKGFSTVRSDRNNTSGKSKGGGICVYMNQK